MKKLIALVAIGAAMFMAGCSSKEQTVDSVYATAYAIGSTAAIVGNECDLSDDVRCTVVAIMQVTMKYCPEPGQSIYDAWQDRIEKHINDIVASNGLSAQNAEYVKAVFGTVVLKGLDYAIVRLGISEKKDLLCAAVDGFSAGFLARFKTSNGDCSDCTVGRFAESGRQFNRPAYGYIKCSRSVILKTKPAIRTKSGTSINRPRTRCCCNEKSCQDKCCK